MMPDNMTPEQAHNWLITLAMLGSEWRKAYQPCGHFERTHDGQHWEHINVDEAAKEMAAWFKDAGMVMTNLRRNPGTKAKTNRALYRWVKEEGES